MLTNGVCVVEIRRLELLDERENVEMGYENRSRGRYRGDKGIVPLISYVEG